MQKLIITAWLLAQVIWAFGQPKVEYIYDNAGNRTSRMIITLDKSAPVDNNSFVGVSSIEKREIKLYPNPTEGILKLEIGEWEHGLDAQATIHDINGKVIYKQLLSEPIMQIDISQQPRGNYIMKLSINGQFTEWKIIKR